MTFYLKYRPQKISELDIKEVRESLEGVVKKGRIPHAFLFSGPKGTGKTSAARIIAKIVNCTQKGKEPCNRCESCVSISSGGNIDVVELDAASHRGIEDIRNLRDAVKLAPAKAKKKVYIIDEVHMLTLEASNALLKTLEEPPSHVIFILATTNPEKLIETIRSRTTNIVFRKATDEEIARSLGRVIKGEKIKIKDESVSLIAKAAKGSFRDATKTLEQLIAEGRSLAPEEVREYLLKTKAIGIETLLAQLIKRDVQEALKEVERIALRGVEMESLIEELLTSLRASLLAKMGIGEDTLGELSKDDLLKLIKLFSEASRELRDAPIEALPLEVAIVQWCTADGGQPQLIHPGENLNPPPVKTEVDVKSAGSEEPVAAPSSVKLSEVTDEVWRRILATVKPVNTSIEALLRAAKPVGFDGKILTLGVYYRFHKERLEDGHHRKILEEVVASVMGSPIRVVCILSEPPAKPPPVRAEDKTVLTEGEDADIIKIAEEIFSR